MPEKAKIFVAEDEQTIRRLLRTMLTQRGHRVVLEAGSLAEALENIKKAKEMGVSVAVIDGSLTGQNSPGDGPKIAEALRKEVPGIKIVSFSGEPVSWGDYNVYKPDIATLPAVIKSI